MSEGGHAGSPKAQSSQAYSAPRSSCLSHPTKSAKLPYQLVSQPYLPTTPDLALPLKPRDRGLPAKAKSGQWNLPSKQKRSKLAFRADQQTSRLLAWVPGLLALLGQLHKVWFTKSPRPMGLENRNEVQKTHSPALLTASLSCPG